MEAQILNQDKKLKIAFIDDETSVLNSLKRVFYKEKYDVYVTTNAFELYDLVKNEDVALVVSDQNMPHEKGNEVLNVVKELSPKTTTMLLTGYADISSVVKAVNEGSIFRYMTKPWKEDDLKRAVRLGVEEYSIRKQNEDLTALTSKQNKELELINEGLESIIHRRTEDIHALNLKLQSSFLETVKIIGALSELSSHELNGHSKRVAKFAGGIAKELGLPEKHQFQVQMAAFLHDIGKITNSGMIRVNEKKEDHALMAFNIVNLVPALKEAAVFIKHHHEVYDGAGFPLGLKGNEIPLGARIVAVADAYDKALNIRKGHESKTPVMLVEELKNLAGFKYDPNVVKAFINFLTKENLLHNNRHEKMISLYELRSGMVIAKPLYQKNGKLVLNTGFEIDDDILERLWKKHLQEPIETEVYVFEKVGLSIKTEE